MQKIPYVVEGGEVLPGQKAGDLAKKNPPRSVSRGLLACGAQGQNRTADTRIFSPLLYRLSYLGKENVL